MNDYIIMNGQVFEFTMRKPSKFKVGGSAERSLSGKLHKDVVATKHRWTFSFDTVSAIFINRLERIFDTHKPILLVDNDGSTYTVQWMNDFEPEYIGSDYFTITVELEEE